jgi:MFS family permease
MDTNPIRGNARILAASLVGTTVEYYDFYIYGYAAALVFGPLFFPAQSPAAQTLLSLATFGLAFVARPVGAIVFGHFGDRIGRKSTLVVSMLLMGGCTIAIAFLPTYETAQAYGAGWVAPALLCLLRFGQGFGLGGEWAGAALLSFEYAPQGWRARFSAMPAIGSTIGNLAGAAVFLTLDVAVAKVDFTTWGWRLPFLISAILVGIALWVRLNIAETPEFSAAVQRAAPPRAPFLLLVARYWKEALAGLAAAAFSFSVGYMSTTFALAQATGHLGYSRESFLFIQLIALAVNATACWLFARRADRTGVNSVLMWATLAGLPIAVAFGPALASRSLLLAGVALCLMQLAWGMFNAGQSAWLARLFPVRVRYTGFAFAFNAGGIIGGAAIPLLGQVMSASGYISLVGLLIAAPGLAALAAVRLARPDEPFATARPDADLAQTA